MLEDVPLFSKDTTVAEAMGTPGAFEIFLALMLDPKIQIINPCVMNFVMTRLILIILIKWNKTFSNLQDQKGTLSHRVEISAKRVNKFKGHLNLQSYQLRSYKVLQCLSDDRNFCFLITLNASILETYCMPLQKFPY